MSAEWGNVKILVFACRWCGLIGADGAGRKRIELPASYRVIPVDCAGYVEPDAVPAAQQEWPSWVAMSGGAASTTPTTLP
jgi:coenzyme F420-reducing hydrogenase delta subunit